MSICLPLSRVKTYVAESVLNIAVSEAGHRGSVV